MTTKNTPALFDILRENLNNERCGVFHLQLKLLFIFSLKLLMLSILVSQVSLVISHKRILVFSMKVIPVLVFKIFCPICAPSTYLKCIAREKSVHVWCAQLMTVSHLNTSVVHGVSWYLRPFSCYVSAFSGCQKIIPDLLGVWVITWM